MTRFSPYNPDQGYLLPPNVKDVLGADHLVFFVHGVVERLNMEEFVQAYGDEGGAVYAPELMLKVWLYAYALGVTSARRLEQRIREDLAFRYLAGGATPDNWALSAFRRRHARGINDVFTQVLELAQKPGRAHGIGKSKHLHDPEHRRMRRKLRDPAGRRIYGQRKAIVEPVFGVLKQQRGLRQFRLRGLHRVGIEFTLAAIGYNLSRLYHQKS